MIRILKSKFFIGAVCLLLAAVFSFLILPVFYRAQSEVTGIVRVRKDVPAGTLITKDLLTTVEVGAYGLSEKILRSEDAVIGKVAVTPLYAGENLWSDRFLTAVEYEAMTEAETKGLSLGKCLVTLQLPSASAGVASILRAGNYVNVYECRENEDKTFSSERIMTGLYIYDVLNSNLESLTELDRKLEAALQDVDTDTDLDFIPVYIVVRCTEAQSRELIRLEKAETMHLTLQRTGG